MLGELGRGGWKQKDEPANMPPLTELAFNKNGFGYRHGAANGAVRGRTELFGEQKAIGMRQQASVRIKERGISTIADRDINIFPLPACPSTREVAFARLADFFRVDGSERRALKLQIKTHDVADDSFRRVGPVVEAAHLNVHACFHGTHAGVKRLLRSAL